MNFSFTLNRWLSLPVRYSLLTYLLRPRKPGHFHFPRGYPLISTERDRIQTLDLLIANLS